MKMPAKIPATLRKFAIAHKLPLQMVADHSGNFSHYELRGVPGSVKQSRTGMLAFMRRYVGAKRKSNPAGVRIVYNRLLGGWFIVRGPHQTPIGGRFDSKAAAEAHLNRKKNPAPRKHADLAAKLYQKFTGHRGGVIKKVRKPTIPDALAVIGEIDFIGYSTVRDGQLEKYKHDFRKGSRPLLCVTADGKQFFALGGAYDFGARGFVDRKR